MRSPTAVVSAAFLAVLSSVAVPDTASASACSCSVNLSHAVPLADTIFVGIPTASVQPQEIDGSLASNALVQWEFSVDTVYRGDLGARVDVWSPLQEGSCGITFAHHRPYLVLGRRVDDGVHAQLCGGTMLLDKAPPDVLASLGGLRVPSVERPPNAGGQTQVAGPSTPEAGPPATASAPSPPAAAAPGSASASDQASPRGAGVGIAIVAALLLGGGALLLRRQRCRL